MRRHVENFAVWLIIRFASSRNYNRILNRLIRAADDYIEDGSHERGRYWVIPVSGGGSET